jgi:cobalamin biosynthesis Mg chelatase CobN
MRRLREMRERRLEYSERLARRCRSCCRSRRKAEAVMGTINSAFSLMTGALDADQAALNVVANNVANANTPGTRRRSPTGRRISPSRSAVSRTATA